MILTFGLILLMLTGCGARIRPKFRPKIKPRVNPRMVRKVPTRSATRKLSQAEYRMRARQLTRGQRPTSTASRSPRRESGENSFVQTVADEATKQGVERVFDATFGSSNDQRDRQRK